MSDQNQTGATAPPGFFQSEIGRNAVTSLVTSVVIIACSSTAVTALVPLAVLEAIKSQVGAIIGAVFALVTLFVAWWKTRPKSRASMIRGVAQLPDVHGVAVSDPTLAAEVGRPEVHVIDGVKPAS